MATLSLAMSTAGAIGNVTKTLVSTYSDNDTDDVFTVKIVRNALSTPATFTVSAIASNGSPTLTTSSNFNKVRKSDALSGTGIPGGATVASINHVEGTDTKALTMSANATAGDGVTPVTVTFTPPAPTGEVFFAEGKLTPNKSASGASDVVGLTIDVYKYTGKNEATANPLTTDAIKVASISTNQHIPTYEANIART